MTEEEKEAFGWLSALDVKSEYEASNKEMLLNLIQKQDTEINKLKCKIKNSIYILKHNIKQFEEYSDSELEEWLNNFDKCAIKKGG